MKTSVLIAACNEEAYIGRTLSRLDKTQVDPLVLVNGSTDETAAIARRFGARVLEREAPGKLPAIQDGLRHLGREALQPVLFMDADSYPAFPRKWAGEMLAHLTEYRPASVSGLIVPVDGNSLDNAVRGTRRAQHALNHRLRGTGETLYGINMGVRIHSTTLLDSMLELPSVWPGEDRALADITAGAVEGYTQCMQPGSMVRASSRYQISLLSRLKVGAEAAQAYHAADYERRAPEGTVMAYGKGTFYPYDTAAHQGFTLDDVLASAQEVSAEST